MARDVFISYQHDDLAVAKRVCAALEQGRISCWIAPRDIRPGQEWATGIVEGVSRCHTLVVILSASTKASRQISRELELADKAGLRMIAFRTAEVEPPPDLIYFLGNVQWVDAFDSQFESAIQRLTEAIASNDKFPAPRTKAHRPLLPIVPWPVVRDNPQPKLVNNWAAKLSAAILLATALAFAGYAGFERHVAREDYAKAWQLMDRDPAAARFEFWQAIRADGRFYQAYCGLATAYLRLNDPKMAQKTIEIALRLQPDATWARTVKKQIEQTVAEQNLHKGKVRVHTESTTDDAQISERL